MDTGVLSPGVKQPVYEADYSQWFTGKVKNGWSYTSAPPICIHDMDKDNFTFTYIYNKNILMPNCSGSLFTFTELERKSDSM
jgi:hypothetical protein